MADFSFSNYGGQSTDPSITSPDYGWGTAPQQSTDPYSNTNYFGDSASDYWSNPFPSSAVSDYTTSGYSSGESNLSGDANFLSTPLEEEEDRKSRTPGMTMGMGPKTPGFWDSGFGKVLRGVTSLHPAGRLGWGAVDLANGRNPLGVAAGFLPGGAGMLARGALDYQNNGNLGGAVGTQAGGFLGSLFGNAVSPGLGAVTGPLGASMGRSLGGTPGINGGVPGQSQGNQNTFDINTVLSGLGGLYSSSKAASALGENQDAIQGQISSLSSMYGPDSAYAKQLRQQLERIDAASGRNSQYGPREAQLQALLADKAASTAGTIGSLSTQSQKLNDQRTQMRNQQLGTLLGMGQRSGLFNSLGSMFNQTQTPAAEAPFIDYGEYL